MMTRTLSMANYQLNSNVRTYEFIAYKRLLRFEYLHLFDRHAAMFLNIYGMR